MAKQAAGELWMDSDFWCTTEATRRALRKLGKHLGKQDPK